MKIAVLSDIHGNVPALETVLEDVARWEPDELIVNGDLINRGPYSLACLHLLQRSFPRSRVLRGNHEDFVLSCAARDHDPEHPTYDLRRFAHWTYAQLGAAVAEVRQWDNHIDLTELDGGALHITHGSRLGNRDGISARTEESELPAKLGERRDLFITSHTHKPMWREFEGTLVVNTGSVGAPFDEDPRACYGRFTFDGRRWRAEVVRLQYDRARAEHDFAASGFLEQGGPLTRLMLEELRHSRMFVGPWMRQYHEAVLAQEISVERAVRDFLGTVGRT
jgi:putative phosphoesterase